MTDKPRIFLIAPDSFKGSINAIRVCDAVEQGVLSVFPNSRVIKVPLADGGEGTVAALVRNTEGRTYSCQVTDPLGKQIHAQYGILSDGITAVIEVAAASGLVLLPRDQRDPTITTSYGTGELIKAALEQGCRRVIVGLGGSATNDYGVGALQALGYSFKDGAGNEIGFGCNELLRVFQIDSSERFKLLDGIEFQIASDVDNPLLGPQGATYTYAGQKGASRKTWSGMEQAIKHFDGIVEQTLGRSVRSIPGSGAAGGFGAGIIAFLDGRVNSGAELVMEMIDFRNHFEKQQVDLVITGEGSLDYQTVHGKLPIAVARIARSFSVPVLALVGSKGPGAEQVLEHGIKAIYSLMDGSITREQSMQDAANLLTRTIQRALRSESW